MRSHTDAVRADFESSKFIQVSRQLLCISELYWITCTVFSFGGDVHGIGSCNMGRFWDDRELMDDFNARGCMKSLELEAEIAELYCMLWWHPSTRVQNPFGHLDSRCISQGVI